MDNEIMLEQETEEQRMAREEHERIMAKLAECWQGLRATDYVALKLAEASGDADAYAEMKAAYADTLAKRAEWRAFIDSNS